MDSPRGKSARRFAALLAFAAILVPGGRSPAAREPVLFQEIPAIAEADPGIRGPADALLPLRMIPRRGDDPPDRGGGFDDGVIAGFGADATALDTARVTLGRFMQRGLQVDLVAVCGGERTRLAGHLLPSWDATRLRIQPQRAQLEAYRAREDCTLHVEITAFETDIPPQHLWRPEAGRYGVLLTRTLPVPRSGR